MRSISRQFAAGFPRPRVGGVLTATANRWGHSPMCHRRTGSTEASQRGQSSFPRGHRISRVSTRVALHTILTLEGSTPPHPGYLAFLTQPPWRTARNWKADFPSDAPGRGRTGVDTRVLVLMALVVSGGTAYLHLNRTLPFLHP